LFVLFNRMFVEQVEYVDKVWWSSSDGFVKAFVNATLTLVHPVLLHIGHEYSIDNLVYGFESTASSADKMKGLLCDPFVSYLTKNFLGFIVDSS
jgi:hypothetical protein